MLPTVVSGSSAGALISSIACTHTDEELQRLFSTPQIYNRFDAADEPYLKRACRMAATGAQFDPGMWTSRLQSWYGDMTFAEAYQRTGRILNITVCSGSHHTRILNFMTSPDVAIHSAVLASAAVPGLLPPMQLQVKTRRRPESSGSGGASTTSAAGRPAHGTTTTPSTTAVHGGLPPAADWTFGVGTVDDSYRLRPWTDLGCFWVDGSFQCDLPFEQLHKLHNVNFTVVSQVSRTT
jgi:predicted acylesterase/phospholipase RssA